MDKFFGFFTRQLRNGKFHVTMVEGSKREGFTTEQIARRKAQELADQLTTAERPCGPVTVCQFANLAAAARYQSEMTGLLN